jgi:T5SS/PEP-CTERM-associated repeat protein
MLAASVVSAFTAAAKADSYIWSAGATGAFTDASDWTDTNTGLHTVPTSTDTVSMISGDVQFSGNTTSLAEVLDGSVTFDLTNGGYTAANTFLEDGGSLNVTGTGGNFNSGQMIVGLDTAADLSISNATVDSSVGTAVIGLGGGDTSSATVDAGGTWNITNNLAVGFDGMTTTLTIQNGGDVESSNNGIFNSAIGGGFDNSGGQHTGSGVVTVTGAGSTWNDSAGIDVASLGTGTLIISAGGQVSSPQGAVSNGFDPATDTYLPAGNGTVTITGATSAWTVANSFSIGVSGAANVAVENSGSLNVGGTLTLGQDGVGTLTIDTGGQVNTASTSICSSLNSGADPSGDAYFLLDGVGSQWTNTGNFTDGVDGPGIATGYVQNNALLTVDGEFEIGQQDGSAGVVVIQANGSANVTGQVELASQEGSIGLLYVDGTKSAFNSPTSNTTIGDNGTAYVTVTDGGNVYSGVSVVGNQTDGVGVVTLSDINSSGGTWTVNGTLTAGEAGSGYVIVDANGTLITQSTGNVILGDQPNSYGELDDYGSVQIGGNVIDGNQGQGSFNVQNGVICILPGDLQLGATSTGSGALDVDGLGSSISAATMEVGGTSTAAGGSGTVEVSDDGTVFVLNTLTAWSGSLIDVSEVGSVTVGFPAPAAPFGSVQVNTGGTFNAAGQINGNLINSGGAINANNLNIAGSLSITSGTVSNTGLLTTTGLSIATAGLLQINNSAVLIEYTGSSPESTIQQYIENGLIVSSFVTGNSSYGIAYADGGDPTEADPNLMSGQVVIEPALLGDTDLNGVVNIHDLQNLLSDFNAPGFWDQGNFRNHTVVDISDLQALLTNFNTNTTLNFADLTGIENLVGEFGFTAIPNSDGMGFTLVSVPEPASLGLMAIGLGLLARRRRRARC